MPSVRKAHYVLSTHWDREWYQPFQYYRHRLVQLLDDVIAGFESGELRGPFQTDGQSILLEDYLEVRKHRRETVERLCREGKFVVGPWYVLPDEFLVSGESLVRNIRLGRAAARRLGTEPSNAGLLCDQFGHISQMPQIFRQFGIRGAFLWRGINLQTRLARWRGADGSELPCYVYGRRGYTSYGTEVRDMADANMCASFDAAACEARLTAYLQQERELVSAGPVLLYDGGDHQSWDRQAYEVLARRLKREQDGYHVVHSSLDGYLDDLLPVADQIDVVLQGELREPGRLPGRECEQWVIPGVLSSRVWIKQENAACEALLCHWGEPLGAMAHALLGQEYPADYLDVAWNWLLQNHPHDSICGCSIDQVHEDMKFRFSQCRQIGERLTAETIRSLVAHVRGDLDERQLRVGVFNPLPYDRDEVVELMLNIPTDWPTFQEFFGYESKPSFRILDAAGRELGYQRLQQQAATKESVIQPTRFPFQRPVQPVRIAMQLPLPATGYSTLTVVPGPEGEPYRHPQRPGLALDDSTIANDVLQVSVQPNGSLVMTDKRNGAGYDRLLTFEDVADIGDGWYHGQAVNDFVSTSAACSADVELVANNPLLATLRVRTRMMLPAEFDFHAMKRSSDKRVTLMIESELTLRTGSDRLEVTTRVVNNVKDHRLRVLLPTGATADTYLADSAYDVIERPIALRTDNHLYREPEVDGKPQQSWSAVFGGGRGLALITKGLKETAVLDTPQRPLALTLYRSTRRTVMTDGEPNGQLLMPLCFEYWLTPLAQSPDTAQLCRLGQMIAAGIGSAQCRKEELAELNRRTLPSESRLLKVKGDVIVTAFEIVNGGYELRAFNPTANPVEARFECHAALVSDATVIQPVNLEHQPVGSPIITDTKGFTAAFQPKQIQTFRFNT